MPRSRAAQLQWSGRNVELELRLAGLEGPVPYAQDEKEVASPKERAAVLARQPVWRTLGALQRDDAFLAGLESIICDAESTDDLAAHQRRDSYGYDVLLFLIEAATQRTIQAFIARDLSAAERRAQYVAAFVPLMAVRYWEGPLEPADRRRWRNGTWRDDAIDTLLARVAGRCIAPGCNSILRSATGRRWYCQAHGKRQRIRADRKAPASLRHDTAIARVAELLGEVGELLQVPRHAA